MEARPAVHNEQTRRISHKMRSAVVSISANLTVAATAGETSGGQVSQACLPLNPGLIRPIILLLQRGILPVILRVAVGAMPRKCWGGL